MRAGVRLGIDAGDVRIGVARSDAAGIMAMPVETVRRSGAAVDRIAALVIESQAVEVVVGWPRSLSGREGPAARKARTLAREVARRIHPVPVRLVDERMSTVEALAGYRAAGLSTRQTRSRVDAAAAAIILQGALDRERNTGEAAGELLPIDRTEGRAP